MDKNKLSTYVENIKKNVFNNWVDVKGSAKVVYERTVSKTKRFFDITYLVFTLISYISFVFYAGTIIKNYGFEDWISIVFLVVLCVYTIVLVSCLCFASTLNQGNKRFKAAWKVFSYFKYATYVIGGVISILALISVFQNETNGWVIFVSIISLISNLFKIAFSLLAMTFKTGAGIIGGFFKRRRKRKLARKQVDDLIVDVEAEPVEDKVEDRMN